MKTILIVEDDSKLALALSVRLKANGFSTWIAQDAITAVATAIRVRPHLILLDVTLPGGNGFELIERFDQFPETRETPIILTTASKDPELRRKSIDMGAAGLLRKPYDPDELLGIVDQVFERWNIVDFRETRGVQLQSKCTNAFKRVLIIEDDQNIASALSIRMAAAGYQTAVANDAISGLRSAVNLSPDMVILDISLPAGNGFSVAERIQANISKPVRIIFLTASKRLDFRQRAEQLGAVGFFEKPYEADSLLNAVRQALN